MPDINLQQKLDDIDLKILRILQEDSRTSYRKIAEILGIAVGTAYNRVRKLEDDGVLKAYTIIIDPTKLNYELTVLILIQAEGQHIVEAEKEVAQSEDTISVYDITGDFDVAVVARFRDRASLNNFVKGMLKSPYVKRMVTSVVLNVVKEDFRVNVKELQPPEQRSQV